MTRGEEQGFDGNKKVKGRKRHIVVDVLGLVLGCYVTSARVWSKPVGTEFYCCAVAAATRANLELYCSSTIVSSKTYNTTLNFGNSA